MSTLFQNHFFPNLIRKHTLAFGTLFNNLQIVKYSNTGIEEKRETVPISYSSKEKFIQKITQDVDLTRKPAITLPRMSYFLTGFERDSSRQLQNKQRFAFTNPSSKNTKLYLYQPVPYNFFYDVYIITKTQVEMHQILEQILPFFSPDFSITLVGSNAPDISFNIPVTFLDSQSEDTYEGEIDSERRIIWTLQFVVKGYLFGPVREGSIIKTIDIKIGDYGQLSLPANQRNFMVDINLVPYINGVPLQDIGPDDDYVIQTTITDL